jgi:RimJ/RimL family protein N-acetyltransferase
MVLRPVTVADVDALVALDADPEVMHFITGGVGTSRAEIEGEVLPHWLGIRAEWPELGFWAAEGVTTGDFLGWFHLRPTDGRPIGVVELGYRLGRSVWGQGLAAEGSRALIEHAFRHARAERVVAETMAVHMASRRVMEKAGMTLVRTFHADWPYRIPGDELGDVEYAITREDWLERHRG